MDKKIDKILWSMFYILVAAYLLFFAVGIIFAPSERQKSIFKYDTFDIEWYRLMDDGSKIPIEVPGKCKAREGEVVTITGKIPKKLELGEITTWICFRTTKQDMEVYIDGKLREKYNTEKTRYWGKTSVSTYFFVPILDEDVGKDINVTFVTKSNYAGVIRNIYCGTASGLVYQFVKENVFEVMSAFFILVLSIASIVLSWFLGRKVGKKFYLGYIGWGEVFLSMWIIAQSPIRQFYFDNVTFAGNITYFSIYLCAIPIGIFIKNVQKNRYSKVYNGTVLISIVFVCMATILQLTDKVDFDEMLPICIAILVSEIIVAIFTMIIDWRKGYIKEYKLIMWGFFGFAACAIIQISMFGNKVAIYKGIFLCVGAILLLIMTGVSTLKDFIRLEQDIKASQLKTEKLTYQIMETLVQTIEAKDVYTKGHSKRVAQYSKLLAQKMEMDEKAQKEIYYMAMLHDIGKIGIADQIINKPGKLTDEEYDMIKSHSEIGYNILKNMSEIKDLENGARWHHERYDGKGYPDGLVGEDIPLFARIIAVSDAYDAMTSNRSYRKELSQKQVMKEIEKGKGSQFDPEIAEYMLELMREDKNFNMRQEKLIG